MPKWVNLILIIIGVNSLRLGGLQIVIVQRILFIMTRCYEDLQFKFNTFKFVSFLAIDQKLTCYKYLKCKSKGDHYKRIKFISIRNYCISWLISSNWLNNHLLYFLLCLYKNWLNNSIDFNSSFSTFSYIYCVLLAHLIKWQLIPHSYLTSRGQTVACGGG